MTTSQSDVDKVMAAFGAAPIRYRPNQDVAAESGAAAEPVAAPASAERAAPAASSNARATDRILPGSGGKVREIFPLLWRAVPVVGDLKIGAIKRAGDEVPAPQEPETPADVLLAQRIQAAAAEPAPEAAPVERAPPPAAVGAWRETVARAETRQQPVLAVLPTPPVAPASALPPLRSHAELIRQVATRVQEPMPGPIAAQPIAPQLIAPAPPVAQMPQPPQVYAPPPPMQPPPQVYAPPPMQQPAMPPPGYPPYYPPQAMPLPPMPPPAAPWPQPSYPPAYAPPYPPAYPHPGAGYPPGYPPAYPPAYPPVHPYGYPPSYPPAYGAPPPYPMPQQAPPEQVPAPPPVQQAAPTPPAPQNLSAIFAALQRARGTDRGEETP
jgi:hypothetical protein